MSQEPKITLSQTGAAVIASRETKNVETNFEPTDRARLAEIAATMRELLRLRRAEERRPRASKLSLVAVVLAFAAFLVSGVPAYFSWRAYTEAHEAAQPAPEFSSAPNADAPAQPFDPRAQLTLAELAKRSPSLRSGNLQAWWAGEQARQVQRLEAQAKRQALAGDREGAARSVSRADNIRSGIPTLAEFEKPATK